MGDFLLKPIGVVAGWCLVSFVIGVGLHSLVPSWHFTPTMWLVLLPTIAFLVAAVPIKTMRVGLAVILALVLGFWRFDVAKKPVLRSFGGRQFIASSNVSNGHPSVLEFWRSTVTGRITSALPSDAAHLVAGMLYGDAQFTRDEKNQFVSAGLMHLVAVSGSNVTIVIQVVTAVTLGIHLKRRRAFVVLTVILVFFVGFVGFSASVARAAIMGWLVLVGHELGRRVTPMRLLLVASVVLLMIQPWQLFFDAGFALSFFAMWGILSWSPFFAEKLSWLPKKFEIRQVCSMTLAATFMTTPYLAWSFGRVTLAGIVTNLFALPLVPFVMGTGAIVAAWGSLPGSVFVSAPALGLSRMIFWIAGLAQFVPWAQFMVRDMNLSTLLATYALILYLERKHSRKKRLSTDEA